MIKLNTLNGELTVDGETIPKTIENYAEEGVLIYDHFYTIAIRKTNASGNIPCSIRAGYKNGNLRSILISIESNHLKANYKAPKDIDFRDYWAPFRDYCQEETKKILASISGSEINSFNWGKIGVSVEPRNNYYVFGEITYTN
jgi:hypothetical protein